MRFLLASNFLEARAELCEAREDHGRALVESVSNVFVLVHSLFCGKLRSYF